MGRITLVTAALALAACSDVVGFAPVDPDLFVVQAYLFAGQTVTEVRVTGVLPIDAEEDEVPPPISDAEVVLIKNDVRHDLAPVPAHAGAYHDPTGGITVEPGDRFLLEVRVAERLATAETIVPQPPNGLELSSEEIEAIDVSLGPRQALQQNALVVRWDNPTGNLHFLTVESTEPDPEILPSAELFEVIGARFTTQPTAGDSSFVSQAQLKYFGLHKVLLYQVNQEYADLYEGLVQDSRDLNEPPSNIVGGLGIFTAFSADSAFFEVRD